MNFKRSFCLYLASQSARRRQILAAMRIPFKVVASRYREHFLKNKSPSDLAICHASGKLKKAILPEHARFILAGDTIVWCRGRFLGKPKTKAEAIRMIQNLSGCEHAVYTGLVLWDRKTNHKLQGCSKTRVWIKRLSIKQIKHYVDAIDPYDKAGAYAIQGWPKIVTRTKGSYSNVVGLPRELLRKMLAQISKKT